MEEQENSKSESQQPAPEAPKPPKAPLKERISAWLEENLGIDSATKQMTSTLAPFLAGTAMLAVLLTLVVLRVFGGAAVSGGSIVTFDVVKYTNAQRAVASVFLKKNANHEDANDLLLGLSSRTRKAIGEVAGSGTLVVLKQSVVQGQTRDITDEVLEKLGMPTNVPTSDAAEYVLDVAPTMLLGAPQTRKLVDLPTGPRESALP